MSNYRRTKLYPSTTHYQHSGERVLPLKKALALLQSLLQSIPEAERDSAFVDGWDKLAIFYDKLLSTTELLNESLTGIRDILEKAKDRELTREEMERLLQLANLRQ